jgi:hypothetical protein
MRSFFENNLVGGPFRFFNYGTQTSNMVPINKNRSYAVRAVVQENNKLYLSVDSAKADWVCKMLNDASVWRMTDLLESGDYKTVKEIEAANKTIKTRIIEGKGDIVEIEGDLEYAVTCLKSTNLCAKELEINVKDHITPTPMI